ncbi:RtcB family protein [Actinotalea sp. M2MS4P-6]|uniref:RtcB family protein n=1 Tax=Actinotalea sp. M2MS4P-6 TaxID=2983762 RepID=UPI0021E394C9|nr:RtcB family protein [Actinotalea sp. M2MS4P-6]MCV2392960.1 RtcB family protein [Actinotalea sp. M2MS4P-6]
MVTRHLSESLISWASILEDDTREQALRTSAMPFVYPHVALMPDAHLGKGATVGSVIPTRGAIIPAAVGVDIGCGMDAVLTQWTKDDVAAAGAPLSALREAIEARIPLSAGVYNRALTGTASARVDALAEQASALEIPDPASVVGNWALQLGSLGSGNHFIEVSLDEQDRVWLFLHSGSRGVGNKIAQHHIAVARQLMDRYFIRLADPDLAYLVEGTAEFWAYIRALRWAQEFARQNRAEMMDRVVDATAAFMGQDVERREAISCHHNYTEQETHFGKQVWLSRKGAIDAHEGVMGLIPGSMGTRSYVVAGKGNKVALCSAPHGAGREYSRSRARRTFTFAQLEEAMEGIEYRRTDAFVDEIPAAYKDIDVVMADAADLVTVRHELRQIVNVKGD